MAASSELRDKPAGIIRVTSTEHAANTILWPKSAQLLAEYSDIKVEIKTDSGLTAIVAQGTTPA